MHMQYTENILVVKMKIFTGKKMIFFLFLLKTYCGYTLEHTHNLCFGVYPCIPQLYYIKVGYKGVYIIRTYYSDGGCFSTNGS